MQSVRSAYLLTTCSYRSCCRVKTFRPVLTRAPHNYEGQSTTSFVFVSCMNSHVGSRSGMVTIPQK